MLRHRNNFFSQRLLHADSCRHALLPFLFLFTVFQPFFQPASAQSSFQKIINYPTGPFGGGGGVADIQSASDSGYIMTGGFSYRHGSGSSGDLNGLMLLKCDSSGKAEWMKLYTNPVADTNIASGYCVRPTSDKGYIAAGHTAGYTSDFTPTNQGIYVVKTDALGNTVWSKQIHGKLYELDAALNRLNYADEVYDIEETKDGGYVMVGMSNSYSDSVNNTDIYLIKLDAAGQIVWSKIYGENGGNINRVSNSQEGFCVRQTADDGYIVAGRMDSYFGGDAGPLINRGCALLKTDPDGNLQWAKTYFDPQQDAGQFTSVEQIDDKGFIVAGHSGDPGGAGKKAWLVKTDSLGNVDWNKCYSSQTYWGDIAGKVYRETDGGYILEDDRYVDSQYSNRMLIKTDNQGNVSWAQKYGEESINLFNQLMTPAKTGGYALFVSMPTPTFARLFVKTDATGNVGDCASMLIPVITSPTLVVNTVQMLTTGGATVAEEVTSYEKSFVVETKDSSLCVKPEVKVDFWPSFPRCMGDSIDFTNNSNTVLFQWNFGDTASGSANTSTLYNPKHLFSDTGSYTITLIGSEAEAGGRSDTMVQTITIFPDKFLKVRDDTAICSGSSIVLIASGGGTFAYWRPGVLVSDSFAATTTTAPTVTTTYSVTGYNGGNCPENATVTVMVYTVDAAISGANSICSGDSTTISASGGNTYLWSTGATDSSLIVSPYADSAYSVTVYQGLCRDSATTTVTVLPNPVIEAGEDITINYGNSAVLALTGQGAYEWAPPEGLSCTDCPSPTATPVVTTIYYITVTDNNGCEGTDSVTVFVNLPCGDALIPTAFSPNNDGYNDVLYAGVRCAQNMNFIIYDRWGDKVFEADQATEGWDGTYKGKAMDPAVFAYYLQAILTDGKTVNKKGNISLVR